MRILLAFFVVTLVLVTPQVRGADEIQYFSILRSLAFDRDLSFENEYRYFYDRDPQGMALFRGTFLEKREPLTGRHINFAPIGSALLWSPFYGVAHIVTLAACLIGFDVAADGFSRPYLMAVAYASAFYAFAGLLFIFDALRRWGGMSEALSVWVVVGIWFATPVLYYMTIAPAFGHAASLFAVSLLLWLSLRARERNRIRDWTFVGMSAGLAAMTRDQEVLFVIVPMLFLAVDALIRRTWSSSLVRAAVLFCSLFLVWSPQFVAYRALNGTFTASPLVQRKLSFGSPHFFQVLLDPGHGLFFWTPIALIAIAGLLIEITKRRSLPWIALGVAFLAQTWINGSLQSWSQAGAFGSRRFVSTSFMLAWGLAIALQALRNVRVRSALVVVCIWWNLSLMVQFALRLMDRQQLEWPRVAVNQLTEVPPRLFRVGYLFLTDRERLVREGPI